MAKREEFNDISFEEMKEFLEEKHQLYNNSGFIKNDPISIPHQYTRREDIEISGFLTATIAWGRRDLIIGSANKLMSLMGESPYSFIIEATDDQLERFRTFYYRTFNGVDCEFFIRSIRNIYKKYNSFEDILVEKYTPGEGLTEQIENLRNLFFSIPHISRSGKHFADITKGAAGKRLNMYLRWMVRNDKRGVDFGLWDRIDKRDLMIPLDLHSGNTARKLGLLNRKGNDWQAVVELTGLLRRFDPYDPVKYDFALFGLGVNERF